MTPKTIRGPGAAHHHWQMLRVAWHLLQTGGVPAFWDWCGFWYWAEFRATRRQLVAMAAYLSQMRRSGPCSGGYSRPYTPGTDMTRVTGATRGRQPRSPGPPGGSDRGGIDVGT